MFTLHIESKKNWLEEKKEKLKKDHLFTTAPSEIKSRTVAMATRKKQPKNKEID